MAFNTVDQRGLEGEFLKDKELIQVIEKLNSAHSTMRRDEPIIYKDRSVAELVAIESYFPNTRLQVKYSVSNLCPDSFYLQIEVGHIIVQTIELSTYYF